MKIRRVNYFDKFKLKKSISFLSPDVVAHYTKVFRNYPFLHFHKFLPLSMKFLPESYIMEDNNSKNILGMITAIPTSGNQSKIAISRLFLEMNYYEVGKQLIDYVIAKYGAIGATSFISIIDERNDELLQLFSEGCGFRQFASEQLWQVENIKETNVPEFVRPFKNSDAKDVAELFNDSLITHYKPSLLRKKEEYTENIFKGLADRRIFRYVVASSFNKNKMKAYFAISTTDGVNFVVVITLSAWEETSIETILKFAKREISKVSKDFVMYIKIRKYTTSAETIEQALLNNGGSCTQTQIVLVKDFYKPVKDFETEHSIILFNDFKERSVYKS
ncbi:MAG: hypothetical protein MJ229_00945 [bacterium]|nr:hypothetical protein [bacterium]